MAILTTIVNDENRQGSRRMFGVPTPQRGDEAVNKWYVDNLFASGGGGASGILDCGGPADFGVGIPTIDCGGIT